jgi:predicted short-subunit dehydrogenase-like oxidoreductase (DUF2520 family)
MMDAAVFRNTLEANLAHEELVRPLNLFAHGYDANDMKMIAESLAQDAELVSGGNVMAGREAIIARLKASRDAIAEQGAAPHHAIVNVLIDELTATSANVRSYRIIFFKSADGVTVKDVGRWIDDLVNEGGTWRIRRRELA